MSGTTYIYPPVTQDPGQLYDNFVSYMQAWIPGWKPFSGELDDWLARAFTVIGAQLMEITSDVATSIFRYFGAYILNYPPYNAVSSLGTVTITVKDTVGGYFIPAYTGMSFPDANGNLQGFETLTDITFAEGQDTVTVTVQAMTPGTAGDGCSGDGDLDSSTPITFITGLSMAASSNGGSDAEDDTAYLNRLATLMTTITPSPITAQSFTTIAMTQQGVGRAFTLGAFDPADWTITGSTHSNKTIDGIADTSDIPVGAPISGTDIPAGAFVESVDSGTQITISAAATATTSGETLTISGRLNQGGMVTTWVVDASGAALNSTVMSTIQAAIQEMCLAGVVYTVKAPDYTTVDVVADVVAWNDPNNPTATVQSDVEAAITNFLTPDVFGQLGAFVGSAVWLNETTVRLSALQAAIMNVSGVHYVSSLTLNGVAADLPLGGVVPLPSAGTIDVTVTTG